MTAESACLVSHTPNCNRRILADPSPASNRFRVIYLTQPGCSIRHSVSALWRAVDAPPTRPHAGNVCNVFIFRPAPRSAGSAVSRSRPTACPPTSPKSIDVRSGRILPRRSSGRPAPCGSRLRSSGQHRHARGWSAVLTRAAAPGDVQSGTGPPGSLL